MSTSVDSHAPEHSSDDAALAAVGVEPDEVSTDFLTRISAAVVLMVVLGVLTAVWLFRWQTASQLEAKGYTVESHAPRPGSSSR